MKKPSQLEMKKDLSQPFKEKRTQIYPRAKISGNVFIHNDEHLFMAPIGNLSAGGIFVEKLTTLSCGSLVKVVVKSPALSGSISLLGKVVRVEQKSPRGIAVEFSSVSSINRQTIQNCVAENRITKALRARA